MTRDQFFVAALIVIGFLAVAVQVAAVRGESRVQPLQRVIDVALARRPWRLAVFALWLWVGWHFLAR